MEGLSNESSGENTRVAKERAAVMKEPATVEEEQPRKKRKRAAQSGAAADAAGGANLELVKQGREQENVEAPQAVGTMVKSCRPEALHQSVDGTSLCGIGFIRHLLETGPNLSAELCNPKANIARNSMQWKMHTEALFMFPSLGDKRNNYVYPRRQMLQAQREILNRAYAAGLQEEAVDYALQMCFGEILEKNTVDHNPGRIELTSERLIELVRFFELWMTVYREREGNSAALKMQSIFYSAMHHRLTLANDTDRRWMNGSCKFWNVQQSIETVMCRFLQSQDCKDYIAQQGGLAAIDQNPRLLLPWSLAEQHREAQAHALQLSWAMRHRAIIGLQPTDADIATLVQASCHARVPSAAEHVLYLLIQKFPGVLYYQICWIQLMLSLLPKLGYEKADSVAEACGHCFGSAQHVWRARSWFAARLERQAANFFLCGGCDTVLLQLMPVRAYCPSQTQKSLVAITGSPLSAQAQLECCANCIERSPTRKRPWMFLLQVLCDGSIVSMDEVVQQVWMARRVLWGQFFYSALPRVNLSEVPRCALQALVLLCLHFPNASGQLVQRLLQLIVRHCPHGPAKTQPDDNLPRTLREVPGAVLRHRIRTKLQAIGSGEHVFDCVRGVTGVLFEAVDEKYCN